jgi:seryl-tRNA synthetase
MSSVYHFFRPLLKSQGTQVIQRQMGTWALSRLSTVSAGRVQPVLDIEYVLKNLELYEDSIEKRKVLPRPAIRSLPKLYEEAVALRDARDRAQQIREEHSHEVAKLIRERKDKQTNPETNELKERGKILRDDLRAAITNFNKVNDAIIDLVISLPNILDPTTPESNNFLRTVAVPEGVKAWSTPPDLEWTVIPGVGPAAEFPRSKASLLELELSGEAQSYLLKNKYTETGNVDFVESTLFDVSGMDPNQFIRIRESNINPVPESHASYLVGGASFPAFLALFAQSLVKNPEEVMPIRYFVIGRSYGRKKYEKNTVYQRSAVQVFIACRTEEEMEQEFENLSNLTGNFLSHHIGTPYTMEQVGASNLQNYERKQVAFLTEDSSKTISSVSAIGDHVSKRLLCCYAGNSTKQAKFMHLVTGRFLNLTDFIRPLELPPKPASELSSKT